LVGLNHSSALNENDKKRGRRLQLGEFVNNHNIHHMRNSQQKKHLIPPNGNCGFVQTHTRPKEKEKIASHLIFR